MKPIALIAAMGRNRAIGRDNQLLWKLPGDLPRFKELTLGKPVVMGRKTWLSLGRPLPGRTNIVLTRDAAFRAEGATVVHTPAEAVVAAMAAEGGEIMVIGGGEIYALFLPQADRLLLTEVDDAPAADAYFPEFAGEKWVEVSRQSQDGTPPFAYVEYRHRL